MVYEGELTMKYSVRSHVFETNSSSVHSLTMCSEEQFNRWKSGELLFDEWSDSFQDPVKLSSTQVQQAKNEYVMSKNEYMKDWDELTEEAKNRYLQKYAKENNILDTDQKSYSEYFEDDSDLYTFIKKYTTQSGEVIVAFGKYGYDG